MFLPTITPHDEIDPDVKNWSWKCSESLETYWCCQLPPAQWLPSTTGWRIRFVNCKHGMAIWFPRERKHTMKIIASMGAWKQYSITADDPWVQARNEIMHQTQQKASMNEAVTLNINTTVTWHRFRLPCIHCDSPMHHLPHHCLSLRTSENKKSNRWPHAIHS